MGFTVRRDCDDKFVQLVELSKKWGHLPFLLGTVEHENLEWIKLQFRTRMSQLELQRKQAREHEAVVAKLSVMDGWSNLSSVQQQQVYDFSFTNTLGMIFKETFLSAFKESYDQQPKPFISASSEYRLHRFRAAYYRNY